MSHPVSKEIREKLLVYQENEITEHHIYRMLASAVKSPENRRVLEKIANDELEHYQSWRTYTQQDVKPDQLSIWKYYWNWLYHSLFLGCGYLRGEWDVRPGQETRVLV